MLNLIPWRDQQSFKQRKKFLIMVIFTLVFTTMLILSMNLYFYHQLKVAKIEKTVLCQKIKLALNRKQLLLEEWTKLDHQASQDQLMLHQKQATNILIIVAENLPSNSYITSIECNLHLLSFQGVVMSLSQEILKNFLSTLVTKQNISLRLTSAKLSQMQKILFKFTINI